MVYQTEAPPVPTRADEVAMIHRIKKSFQDQPYYKYYMNEGVRLRKMEHAEGLNQHKLDKRMNRYRGYLFTAIIAAPLVYKYYSWGPYGVPAYHYPIRYEQHFFQGHNGARKLRSAVALFAIVYVGGSLYSNWRTSQRFKADEYMERATVKLPY